MKNSCGNDHCQKKQVREKLSCYHYMHQSAPDPFNWMMHECVNQHPVNLNVGCMYASCINPRQRC